MTPIEHVWVFAEPPEPAAAAHLAQETGLPAAVARLLLRRGISDPTEANAFLAPSVTQLGDPTAFVDLDLALDRIERAIETGERILVHGDYDVDGTTSTSLLVRVLGAMGADVGWFIPHRIEDGYGLSSKGVAIARSEGAGLIITADCGIGAVGPIAEAKAAGMDTIVTDHHEVGSEMPDAVAIVNPKRPDCTYPFKDFAGVGVVFKLLQGLIQRRNRDEMHLLERDLDLVALGTVADVVPLRGENRVLAAEGLKRLASPDKAGVKALIEVTGLLGKPIDSSTIAFVLAPRINAAGRLGDSVTGIELFLSDDATRARELAEQLEVNNADRRRLNESMLEEAIEMVGEQTRADPIVLWSDTWHSGVLGIVAAKLVERYRVPTILIAVADGFGRGSGRSVRGFNLVGALGRCNELLEEWGGHKYAVGLKIRRDQMPAFRDHFVATSREELSALDRRPTLYLEETLTLAACTRELALTCERLAPFGYDNPEPVFFSEGLQLSEAPRRTGDRGQHLRITAYQDGHTREGIGFGLGEQAARIDNPGQSFALAHVPTINRWRGRERVQLVIKDIRTD